MLLKAFYSLIFTLHDIRNNQQNFKDKTCNALLLQNLLLQIFNTGLFLSIKGSLYYTSHIIFLHYHRCVYFLKSLRNNLLIIRICKVLYQRLKLIFLNVN